jgi:hypothetical protein
MRDVKWSWRGSQWWPASHGRIIVGESHPATVFDLQGVYGTLFHKDVILEMTPLIYQVETNGQSARLISFPVVRVRLQKDGTIKKLE